MGLGKCLFTVALFCLSLSSPSWSQKEERIQYLRGSVSDGNSYTNPALGITVKLPGDWQLLQMTTETPSDPRCTGPLCGKPDVNVVLESQPQSNPRYRLYLSGWKLSAQYLNRDRYPLKWFANIMLEGSMDRNLVPLEKQTAIRINGRQAFRVLAAAKGDNTPRLFGYVSEANGYVFLLVGAAPLTLQPLQTAIEGMMFH